MKASLESVMKASLELALGAGRRVARSSVGTVDGDGLGT